ncbi:hypothetical protein NE237_011398 [Protea cynaroides]|uniref:O-fucosyltransferase family protein n=1 Tax=Protea cynaroides TaxID=273540 RepID=A0A9Q0GW21_9MAGN|nr:hypothetical protein NE237_011398 [Protea cynaroides]
MAAHSACDFSAGKAEKLSLVKYKQVIWQGRVLNSQFTDEEVRNQGRCPLTLEEIGLLLAALGINNSTCLYLVSHKVYGGEARIVALCMLFPLIKDKKSHASSEERAKIQTNNAFFRFSTMASDLMVETGDQSEGEEDAGFPEILEIRVTIEKKNKRRSEGEEDVGFPEISKIIVTIEKKKKRDLKPIFRGLNEVG